MQTITTPLQASRALDSMADDIGNPLIDFINALSLTEEEKIEAKAAMENVLSDIFTGDKLFQIKNYFYTIARALNEVPRN